MAADREEFPVLCPCGSGLYGYKLFGTRGEFLLYCCARCETQRRSAASAPTLEVTINGG